jgi:hypothetical protein
MAQVRPLLTTDPGPRFDTCKREAVKLLGKAAVEWSHGDPSAPDPGAVLEQIIDIFAREQFLRRPYGSGK